MQWPGQAAGLIQNAKSDKRAGLIHVGGDRYYKHCDNSGGGKLRGGGKIPDPGNSLHFGLPR